MSKVKLGDVATERKETCKAGKEEYPIVGLEHLIPEEVTLSSWDENKENTFTKVFREGDVLFGRRRAYLKKAAVAPFDGICSGDITVIKADDEKIYPRLLPFIIQNDALFDFAVENSAGSLSPRVKWEHLKNFEFELPEMDQQKKLAEVLWAIDDTKKAYQNLIQKTDELVKSQFIEMFGNYRSWDNTIKLGSLCTSISDGSHNPPKGVGYSENLMISSKNISDGLITFDDPRYLSDEEFEAENKRTNVKPGDVLLTIVGAIGRVAVVPDNIGKIALQRSVAVMHLNPKIINSIFLMHMLRGLFPVIDAEAHGIAQRGIYLAQVKDLDVICPEIDEQKKFVTLAVQSDKSKFELEQALAELTATYKRIISENLG